MDQHSGDATRFGASATSTNQRLPLVPSAEVAKQILLSSYRNALLPRENSSLRYNEIEFVLRFSPEQLAHFGRKHLEFIVPPALTAYLSRAGGSELVIGDRSVGGYASLQADAAGSARIAVRYKLLAPDDQQPIKKIVVKMVKALASDMREARRMDAAFGPIVTRVTEPKRNLDPIEDYHFLSAQKVSNEPHLSGPSEPFSLKLSIFARFG